MENNLPLKYAGTIIWIIVVLDIVINGIPIPWKNNIKNPKASQNQLTLQDNWSKWKK